MYLEQTMRYLKVSHLSMNKQAERKQSLECWNEATALALNPVHLGLLHRLSGLQSHQGGNQVKSFIYIAQYHKSQQYIIKSKSSSKSAYQILLNPISNLFRQFVWWGMKTSLKGVVCDSGENLLIFELNRQTNTPLHSVSFKLVHVTHSISLSCVQAPVVTYYTKAFSGNVTKTSVSDDLCWWQLCLFPVYRDRAVCKHQTPVFSAHTENGKLADCGEILSEFDKGVLDQNQTTPLKKKEKS